MLSIRGMCFHWKPLWIKNSLWRWRSILMKNKWLIKQIFLYEKQYFFFNKKLPHFCIHCRPIFLGSISATPKNSGTIWGYTVGLTVCVTRVVVSIGVTQVIWCCQTSYYSRYSAMRNNYLSLIQRNACEERKEGK